MKQPDLIKTKPSTVRGRIIAGAVVEDVADPDAYMDVTVRIPKGLGRITMGKTLILTQPEEA